MFYLLFLLIFFSPLYPGWNFGNQKSNIKLTEADSSLTLESSITGFDGTLHVKDNTAGTIVPSGSETITFDGGVLKTGETSSGLVVTSKLTGVFDPATTDSIDLQADDYIDVSAGTVLQAVTVDSGAAGSITASIYGEPKFSSAITLGAATDTLQLGITSSLNQDITGSGTLRLLNDLAVDYNVQIEPNVDLDGKRLVLGGGTYNDALTFSSTDGDGIIEFTHMINLEEAWTITATTCTINGNGNTIDLSNASAQLVGNGTTLTLSNMHIVGLSGTKLSGTGETRFCNCTLSLTGNYTKSAGGDLTFYCDNSKVITNGSTFVVDTTPEINVDGVVLFYEQLDGSGNSPFTGSTTNLTNGGVIRSTVPVGSPSVTTGAASYTLGDNYNLSSNTTITFSNAGSVTVDGNGQFISLPCQAGTYLDVSTPTDVTFSDIVFKDFNPESINGMDAVRFGDDVYIELGKDLTIESADDAWVCTGNVTIDGNGHTLRVEKASGITLSGTKTLTLKNLTLETSVVGGLSLGADTDFLTLDNMTFLSEDAGFTLGTGNLNIEGFVEFKGRASSGEPPLSTFEFSSGGNLTINSNSTLFVGRFVQLLYDCGTKTQFFFTDKSSELFLNGCSFDSGSGGVQFSDGTLIIKDRVDFNISTATDAESVFQATFDVFVLAKSHLNISGPLIYTDNTLLDTDTFQLKQKAYGYYLYRFLQAETYSYAVGADTESVGSFNTSSRTEQNFIVNPTGAAETPNGTGLPIVSNQPVKIYNNAVGTPFNIPASGGPTNTAPESSPSPPWIQVGNNNASGSIFFIQKVGASNGDSIFDGDTVVLTQQTVNSYGENSNWCGTDQTFLHNPGSGLETWYEIAGHANHDGTNPAPVADIYKEWVIEKV